MATAGKWSALIKVFHINVECECLDIINYIDKGWNFDTETQAKGVLGEWALDKKNEFNEYFFSEWKSSAKMLDDQTNKSIKNMYAIKDEDEFIFQMCVFKNK